MKDRCDDCRHLQAVYLPYAYAYICNCKERGKELALRSGRERTVQPSVSPEQKACEHFEPFGDV